MDANQGAPPFLQRGRLSMIGDSCFVRATDYKSLRHPPTQHVSIRLSLNSAGPKLTRRDNLGDFFIETREN